MAYNINIIVPQVVLEINPAWSGCVYMYGVSACVFYWHRCPDEAKIRDKMIYASTKDTVKKALTGLSLEFQANSHDDMDYNSFAAEVERKAYERP